jgi:fatty acid desaturase
LTLNIDIQPHVAKAPVFPPHSETSVEKPQNELVSLSFYQQELKKHLPESVFERTPLRALHLVSFLLINGALIYGVIHFNWPWYAKLLASIFIGQLNAGLAFVAHETLHGSLVKNRFLQNVIGSIGFAPFLVSATYWRFWHNTLHHGNTQLIYKDPDAFPTLSVYKRSKFMQVVFELAPGSKNPLSFFYLFYWFSFQSILNQSYMRFKNKMWANMDHKKVTREFSLLAILGLTYLYFVGLNWNLLWLVAIPLAVQNYVILSYILTNHNISPLTKINDPLANSLTVTTHPICDLMDLNFGYHVEHHLFPRVSGKHAKKIHLLLKELYPDKYKFMPKWRALKYLYQTPRLYKNSNELVCPKTQETFPTI